MDDELLKLIRELADELENEIRDRYSDGNYSIHHAYQRRFERDMITILSITLIKDVLKEI